MNYKPQIIFQFGIFILSAFLVGCNTEGDSTLNGDGVFAVEIGDSQIPYITINTNGTTILNEPKVAANMSIYVAKAKVQEQTIGIEYRGSTSFRISDKKSFGIETWDGNGSDTQIEFFDFPEEEDFILNGHVVNNESRLIIDRTLIYHHFGYELSRSIGRYASRSKFAEVEINGEYQGVYAFMEKLKRDKERINIKKLEPADVSDEAITGGYILKIDKTSGGNQNIGQPPAYFENNWEDDARYTAENSFRSKYDINRQLMSGAPYGNPYHPNMYLETYFLYEYPDAADITTQQKAYIQKYLNDFETALLTDNFATNTRSYTNFIDVASFVDYFLLTEVCKNVDAYRLSTYLYKDRGKKLHMGPIWDLNIGFDSGDRIPVNGWVMDYNKFVGQDAWMVPFWWPRLMEDPQFRAAVKARWQSLRGNEMSTSKLQALVDANVSYLKSNGAVERNYTKWNVDPSLNYDASVQALKTYLQERTAWMDGEIGKF
jgi:hypothetical protein